MSPVRACAAVLTAALLLCGISPPTPAAPAPAKPDVTEDFKYLPEDTNLLFIIQMDKVLSSDGFKKLRKDIPMLDKELDSGFRKQMGFEITNIERLAYGGSVKGNQPIGVVHLKNAVKAETITKARMEPRFEGDKGTTFKEEKVGTFTMYVPNQEYQQSFCLVNDKTLLLGRVKELKLVLERNKKVDLNAALQAALKEADATATVIMVMDVKALFAAEKPPPIPGVDFDKIRGSVSGASLTIKLGSEVTVRGVAVCNDAKAAEVAKTQAEAIRTAAIDALKKVPANAVPKDILDLPGKIKFSTKGNLGEATVTVKEETIINLIKTWFIPQPPRPDTAPVETKPIKD